MNRTAFSAGLLAMALPLQAQDAGESLAQVRSRLAAETARAYQSCPYSFLSKDYFARFNRNPGATPTDQEIPVEGNWTIIISSAATPLTEIMATHLAEFLAQRMNVDLAITRMPPDEIGRGTERAIVVLDSGGGDPSVAESFTVSASALTTSSLTSCISPLPANDCQPVRLDVIRAVVAPLKPGLA